MERVFRDWKTVCVQEKPICSSPESPLANHVGFFDNTSVTGVQKYKHELRLFWQ